MTRFRIIMTTTVAVVCLAGVSACSAFAVSGEISSSLSHSEVPVEKNFSGSSAKAVVLETVKGSKVECSATGFTGMIETTKSGQIAFTLTGCKSLGLKCDSAGKVAGEVNVPVALEGSIISGTDYLLNKVSEFDIKCSTVDVKVKGDFDVPAAPEDTLQSKYTFAAKGSVGVQSPVDSVMPHLEANFVDGGFEHASLQDEGLETTFLEMVAFI
jgi:hypothetical protein